MAKQTETKKKVSNTTPAGDQPQLEDIVMSPKKKKNEINHQPTLKVLRHPSRPQSKQAKKKVVVAFGKFSPPTKAHQVLIQEAALYGQQIDADCLLLTTPTQHRDFALDFSTKISMLNEGFGEYVSVVSNPVADAVDLFKLLETCYDELTVVVGPDRYQQMKRLAEQYNHKDFSFDSITVVNYNNNKVPRDGVSSSLLREAIASNDVTSINNLIAPNLAHRVSFLQQLI